MNSISKWRALKPHKNDSQPIIEMGGRHHAARIGFPSPCPLPKFTGEGVLLGFINSIKYLALICILLITLTACGFRPAGEVSLAPPLQRMYIQSSDPYGHLVRNLKEDLKMSKVQLVASPSEATTILTITQDDTSQTLLSVSSTQQTRQYSLKVTVTFDIADAKGRIILPAQTLGESRTITVQSNQILGSSNEANLFYQQMRRALATAIVNRIASKEVTSTFMQAFPTSITPKKS